MKKNLALFTLSLLVLTIGIHSLKNDSLVNSKSAAFRNPKLLQQYLFQQKKEKKSRQKYDRPDLAMQEEVLLRSEIGKPFSYKGSWRLAAQKQALLQPRLFKTAGDLTWEERGPGNVGGRTRALIVHPQHPNTWWAGAVGGGVWETTDRGNSWTCLTDSLPTLSVTTIALCLQHPDTLYFGTGEGFYNSDAIVGDGIFRTNDGGRHWEQLGATMANTDFRYVNRIVVHPENPDTVLAATNHGLFRSADGGTSWTEVFNNGYRVQQIIANPLNFHTLFIAVNSKGIYKSTDMGSTWNKVSEEITSHYRIEMAISKTDTDYVYASAVNGDSGLEGFYRSTDGGQNWEDLGNSTNWLGGQGWYDNTLLVHTFHPEIVFVGGIDLYRVNTANQPASVTPISQWYGGNGLPYVHADQHFISAIPNPDSSFALIAANDGGVFLSEDQGTTWISKNNQYNVTQFYDVDRHPFNKQYIAGAQDNGSNLSLENPDLSSSWTEVVGGDGFDCAWDKGESEILYATLYDSRVYRSADGGDHFGEATNGFPESNVFHTPLEMDPHNSKKLFTISETDKIYFSTDGAHNWQSVNCDLDGRDRVKISVSQKDSNIVWAASTYSHINLSTDAGHSFNLVSTPTGAPSAHLTGLATSPFDSATALALFGVYGYGKIFRTKDLGISWEDISNNLPEIPVHCALIMPYDSTEIWAGTDIGLFISHDNGQHWDYANHNLPAVSIRRLKIVGKEIIAATHGRGVWSVFNDKLEQQELPLNPPILYTLNYPNPLSAALKINFKPRGDYDSMAVVVNDAAIETFTRFTAYQDSSVTIATNIPDYLNILIRAFKDNQVLESSTRTVATYDYLDSLSEDFNSGNSYFEGDFIISQDEGFSSNALHSIHPYANQQNYISVLASPLNVSDGLRIHYKDVAIVEPGETNASYPDQQMWDYVAVEYSTDGENWNLLSNPYDSRFHDDWKFYFDNNMDADEFLFKDHEIILSDSCTSGVPAYIRFRLFADAYTTGWGWSIDDVYIGKQPLTGIEDEHQPVYSYKLQANYPNPFNPTTQIRYTVGTNNHSSIQQVSLSVYNALGQKVKTLVNEKQKTGNYSVSFNAFNLASGIYFYRFTAGTFSKTRKMILLR